MSSAPVFFDSPAEFRAWLEQHHATAPELWVGFHKKASGRGGLTYTEAVEEALCFGWIDGLLKPIDPHSYRQRFTPRRPRSIWSNINVARVKRLRDAGRMKPAGLAAFASRDPGRTGIYSFERRPRALPAAFQRRFRAEPAAWAFWRAQPDGCRRTFTAWVLSAKREPTRERRFAALIAACAAGRRLDRLSLPSGGTGTR